MSRARLALLVGIFLLIPGQGAVAGEEAAIRGVATNVMVLASAQETPSPSTSAPTSSPSPSPSPAGAGGRFSGAGFVVLGLLLAAFLLLRTRLLRRSP